MGRPDTLQFDGALSACILHGVAIGPGVGDYDIARSFGVAVRPVTGLPEWTHVERSDLPINFSAAFRNGLLHSGYFWVPVPSKGWEDYERAEIKRRNEHELLMRRIFGALSFEDARIRIELIREPRGGMEQISWQCA